MIPGHTTPIDAARARLHAALLAGQDTTAHRRAIEKLEGAVRAAQERQADVAEEAAVERVAAIQQRAAQIAGEVQSRVDAVLAKFSLH